MGHSALRRHHLRRMKSKAASFGPTWELLYDHLASCSCHLCRNPRHSKLLKGDDLLTMQERKALTAPVPHAYI